MNWNLIKNKNKTMNKFLTTYSCEYAPPFRSCFKLQWNSRSFPSGLESFPQTNLICTMVALILLSVKNISP